MIYKASEVGGLHVICSTLWSLSLPEQHVSVSFSLSETASCITLLLHTKYGVHASFLSVPAACNYLAADLWTVSDITSFYCTTLC